MTIVTIYSLFGDDINHIAFDKRADDVFNGLTIAALICFSIEMVLACIAIDEYLFGFYFWLDLVSTISLIADISWVMEAMLGLSTSSGI